MHERPPQGQRIPLSSCFLSWLLRTLTNAYYRKYPSTRGERWRSCTTRLWQVTSTGSAGRPCSVLASLDKMLHWTASVSWQFGHARAWRIGTRFGEVAG